MLLTEVRVHSSRLKKSEVDVVPNAYPWLKSNFRLTKL